jgi:glycosyltransferase involved in cell wall biosynthesis
MSQCSKNFLPVTVAVPVKNEEANLARCLDRLGRFAEIVVIDSGSSDRTCEIAREYGARIVNFDWNGKFPKKRNWFLMNDPPKQEWVLFLDADEFVDDAFCDALEVELPGSAMSAYWISYDNFFLGQPLRHGVTQRKMALLRVGKALFERIDEHGWSQLDMEIHEHPIVEGEVGEIGARIEHRDDRGLAHFIMKHRDYAQWEASRFAKMQGDEAVWAAMTDRQRFKYRHLRKWWFPWFYFAATYIAKLGFLDGEVGFHYAAYKAWYFQTIRLLIQERSATLNADR